METSSMAKRIRAFRKLKGHTQHELAERLGISVSILGAIERGTRKPEGKLLKKIAEALYIEVDELTSA